MAVPNSWQERVGRRGFLDHLRDQRVNDARLSAILLDAADTAEREALRILSRTDAGVGAQVRRQQYELHARALRQLQAGLWDDVSVATRQGLERATATAVEAQARYSTFLARAARVEGISTRALETMLANAARDAADRIRARLMNDIDLSPLVYKNRDLAAGRVDRVVNQGLGVGRSAKEIAESVKHLIRPDTPGGVSYAAMRLGRTELNNAFHSMSILSAADQPWSSAMQWNLSGSHPREDECDDYADADNGLGPGVYPVADMPAKPHPNCLCFSTTISVPPQQFADQLVGGDYDEWLEAHGQVGFGEAASSVAG